MDGRSGAEGRSVPAGVRRGHRPGQLLPGPMTDDPRRHQRLAPARESGRSGSSDDVVGYHDALRTRPPLVYRPPEPVRVLGRGFTPPTAERVRVFDSTVRGRVG